MQLDVTYQNPNMNDKYGCISKPVISKLETEEDGLIDDVFSTYE